MGLGGRARRITWTYGRRSSSSSKRKAAALGMLREFIDGLKAQLPPDPTDAEVKRVVDEVAAQVEEPLAVKA